MVCQEAKGELADLDGDPGGASVELLVEFGEFAEVGDPGGGEEGTAVDGVESGGDAGGVDVAEVEVGWVSEDFGDVAEGAVVFGGDGVVEVEEVGEVGDELPCEELVSGLEEVLLEPDGPEE